MEEIKFELNESRLLATDLGRKVQEINDSRNVNVTVGKTLSDVMSAYDEMFQDLTDIMRLYKGELENLADSVIQAGAEYEYADLLARRGFH